MGSCFECGAPSDHDHHVVPRSLGGTRTIPLCERHHAAVHGAEWLVGSARLTRLALAAKKARGERVGGVPFGFCVDTDGRTLVPHEGEQETIAMAVELRALGMPFDKIADAMASSGRVSRTGKRFFAIQISRMVAGSLMAAKAHDLR